MIYLQDIFYLQWEWSAQRYVHEAYFSIKTESNKKNSIFKFKIYEYLIIHLSL